MNQQHSTQAMLALLLGALILLAGCKDPIVTSGDLVEDFTLLDVNPSSTTHDQPVSPRDYMQKVSAWYFGHAT